jgi:hypothetical protein
VLEALGERQTPEQILELKVCDPAMGSGAFLVEACRQLAERLVTAWEVHDAMPELPPDEEALLHARRLVAQRCLYGVDKNPFAVNLAKLSLWLVTLARDHAFTFLDHALKCGDSLVGLTKAQIGAFDWKPKKDEPGPLFDGISQEVKEAAGWRDKLQSLDEGDYIHKKEAWWEAESALHDARLVGDLCIAAFFGADKTKAREELRRKYRNMVDEWKAGEVDVGELRGIVEQLREGEKPVPPFHWEIEFPEVFGRENPGFDAMVGNPPFLGGHKVWPVLGGEYRDFLQNQHEHSGGKAVDLVAHFFRRSYTAARESGCVGLIATNTLAQGDTREAGLLQICLQGGRIYNARKRVRWPGMAAVHVSFVHFRKGAVDLCFLNNMSVKGINSHLFPRQDEFMALPLKANQSLSYRGSMVYGMGFTFDDQNDSATPLSYLNEVLLADPKCKERVFRFIGGQDINSNSLQTSNRFIIDFEDMTLDQAREWPSLLDIVREKVKPDRDQLGGYGVAERRRCYWWQYGSYASALKLALAGIKSCLALSQVSANLSISRQATNQVFAHTVIVFPLDTSAAFCALQSRPHEVWARFFGSSMKDDLRYTPSDCFETFPFPVNWQTDPTLEAAGKTYYEFRADLMIRNNEGLTKTYNRFHDPDEHDPKIVELRRLHAAMDRAVLDAYGWSDIPTDCEFLLDYEIDEATWSPKRKKPYRYRWPEAVHDEVLARLLDLNQQRYQEEVRAGLHADKKPAGKKAPAKPSTKKVEVPGPDDSLFADQYGDEDEG